MCTSDNPKQPRSPPSTLNNARDKRHGIDDIEREVQRGKNCLTIGQSINESFGSGRQCAEEMRGDEINFNQIGGLYPLDSVMYDGKNNAGAALAHMV